VIVRTQVATCPPVGGRDDAVRLPQAGPDTEATRTDDTDRHQGAAAVLTGSVRSASAHEAIGVHRIRAPQREGSDLAETDAFRPVVDRAQQRARLGAELIAEPAPSACEAVQCPGPAGWGSQTTSSWRRRGAAPSGCDALAPDCRSPDSAEHAPIDASSTAEHLMTWGGSVSPG
jgi:hypothetical protein